MKKLIISLILVVTAFFLGGLQEVKAANYTSLEADGIYIYTSDPSFFFNFQTREETVSGEQRVYLQSNIYGNYSDTILAASFSASDMQNTENFSISFDTTKYSHGVANLMTAEYAGDFTFNTDFEYVDNTFSYIVDGVSYGIDDGEIGYVYFVKKQSGTITASGAEFIIQGNKSYLAFDGETLIDVNNLSATLDTFEIDIPQNATGLFVSDENDTVLFDWDSLGTLPDVSGYDHFSIVTSTNNFNIDIVGSGTAPYTTRMFVEYESGYFNYDTLGYTKFKVYFEIETVTTSDQFQVVPVNEKFYMHLYDFMGTSGLSNVILVNSTEKIDTFTTLAGSTGIPFASVSNAVSINIGYQSAGVAYDNATTYSPKSYTLNPNEEYQFYLNRDSNGLYISTDSTVWSGKWYVRTATGTYSPSAFIYFTTDRQPVLDGQVAFISNISNPMSEANIRTYITAIDDYDGDITHLIQYDGGTYESNRIANTLIPNQSYTILYSVQDSSGNETQLTVTVLVKDVTGPTFGIASPTRTVSYKDTFNVEGFKTSLLVTDNYSTAQNITITVIGNTYTANKSVPGTYQLTYQATDQFGNSSTKVISITVIDNVGPVFSGVSTVVKPVQSVLTANDIISQVIASDEISGNVTASIQIVTDNYTGNGATIGNYSIIVRATDAAGNTTDYTITVQVRDSLPPVFYVKDGYFINVEDTVTLTIGDIITILERTGQLVINSTTNYTVLVNEYSGNEDIEGIYTVSIKFNSTNGTEVIKSVAVNVINTEDPTGTITPDQTITGHLLENWYWYVGGIAIVFVLFGNKKSYKSYRRRG